jgi:hypothetical protein
LEIPDTIQTVTEEQLLELAGRLPIQPTEKPREAFDVEEWLKKYEVPIAFDREWNQSDHKWIFQCPWNYEHKNNSAFIVQFANGGVAAGCLHKSCAGKNWPELRRMVEGKSEDAVESSPSPSFESVVQRKGQASQLIDMANPNLKLFKTPQGDLYATMTVENHDEHHPVQGAAFSDFITRVFFQKTKTVPKSTAVKEAINYFSGVAKFESPTYPIFIRTGKFENKNYLDLADDQWRAIEFGVDGWRVINKPPIRFWRPYGMLPLPTPQSGSNINSLREFLSFSSFEDFLLFITHVVHAMFPTGPYAVLVLSGEAGSGKSTTARIHRKLIDPNQAPVRSLPKDECDLIVAANNGWVLSFDNLSFLRAWSSDAFCRLSTGGGSSTRWFYTNTDEFIFDGQRPIVINGIGGGLPSRSDLLQRSVLIELPVRSQFLSETDFWRKFDAAYPQLLGALLDVAVGAMQCPKTSSSASLRMADFALMGIGVESAMKLPRGTFMRAYNRNRQDATTVAFESCPISNAIQKLATKGWRGSCTELLKKLNSMEDQETRSHRYWPKAPNKLSEMLKRLNPSLREVGIEITSEKDNTRNRNRIIEIRQMKSRAAQPTKER